MNRTTNTRTLALVFVAGLVLAVALGGLIGASTATHSEVSETISDTPVEGENSFVGCVNGTSRAMVACGYSPGPTSVALVEQETGDMSVEVRAVELEKGGFVAIHRSSFVDGNVMGSMVGTSSFLGEGLHKNVEVSLDTSPPSDEQLLAVVYKDTDSDGVFDFVSSQGSEDRPYTKTYTEAEGNVTTEAGDVIGDFEGAGVEPDDGAGNLFTEPLPVSAFSSPPTNTGELDPTLYEDLDGDGDGLEIGPAIDAFGEIFRRNLNGKQGLGLSPSQAEKLDWDEDSPRDTVTIDDMISLFGEKFRE